MIRYGVIVLLVLLTGCAPSTRPDLGALYAVETRNPDQPPVILIHGLLGARLADADSGKELWPGSLKRILFSDYEELALEIDPRTLESAPSKLLVTGITDTAAGRDFYGRIMETLEDFGAYTRATPGTRIARGEQRYYVFEYDWRQDNVLTARKLDALIGQIRVDHGNPDLQVDIVAHSMGGLIARYYLRYGTTDVLNDNDFPINNHGAQRVRRVVLLGTPNLGSASALQILVEGVKIGFGRMPPEVAATFPSGLQLLPHPINSWLVLPDGSELDRDLFDVGFWRRFQFAVFAPDAQQRILARFHTREEGMAYIDLLQRFFEKHLERARRFVWSLTVELPEHEKHLIVFGGDCLPTPARMVVEEFHGESVIRLYPQHVRNRVDGIDYERLMLEPGDGTVTKASLLARQSDDPSIRRHGDIFFPLDYPLFVCESHEALTGNINFQDNLLHALLSVDPT